MDTNHQRLWRKFNALFNGYKAYYALASERLKNETDELDPNEKDIVDQNFRLYGQYLRRLERMHHDLLAITDAKRRKTYYKNGNVTPSKLSVMEELDGMVGRLKVEVQAIIGFARLNQGDVFEVSIKHGTQKWKTRGKTQPDRTQRWDTTNHQFTCYPDQPLIVKVIEVRMIKSKTLSERTFDPLKFISSQPFLVTMNLNSIGSLKLKMVISWLPLMTSKAIQAPNANMLNLSTNNDSVDTVKLDNTLTNGNDTTSSPRICLREKKRGRQNGKDTTNWRSSTTILDSVYKDLSKSIPTIDDLTAFGSSNQPSINHHKMRSDSTHSSIVQKPTRFAQPQMGVQALCNKSQINRDGQWPPVRSLSMHHLADNASKTNNTKGSSLSRSSVYCTDSSRNGQETTNVVVELRARKSTDSDDSSGVSSLCAHGSLGKHTRLTNFERVDSLLQLIDRLRSSLTPLRSSEYAELAAFEAVMLNWEASLKLNRALFVENTRSSVSARRGHENRLAKRASLYSVNQQPSPPSTLSSEDSNERSVIPVNGDHIFENDSGIDSLRQQISPYNRHRSFGAPYFNNGNSTRCSNTSVMGPAQRRFNKHMQERRRRSLGGWILDDPVECERWLSALNGNDQSGCKMIAATGHPELDLCLQHHLSNSLIHLKELAQIHGPLEFRTNELLNKIEQNTVAMEEMLRIADGLPAWPNVTNLLSDLGADWDQQEIWLSTCYSQNASIIVPVDRLRINLHTVIAPVVKKVGYPQLVARVVDTLISNLQQTDNANQCVSVFEFGALFSGKQLSSYVESLAHEAFITTSLESQKIGAVREIMERLRQVPIVPPIESLRHIGLVIQSMESGDAVSAIERYFRSASNELQNDLTISFMNLLEHNDYKTRVGACKALAILMNEQCLEALAYLTNQDPNANVRQEAKRAMDRISHFFNDFAEEITKI